MTYRLKTGLLIAVCGTVLLLGGCGDDAAAPVDTTPTTASALAVTQISQRTCDTSDAETLNGRSFGDDETETDVSMLMPGCQM